MKARWGSGGIAQRILDLCIRWRWVVSFTALPLYPQGQSSWYPFERRLGGSQSRSGRRGEERTSQPLPWLEPPIIHPVAQSYTTELFRLLHYDGISHKSSIRHILKIDSYTVTATATARIQKTFRSSVGMVHHIRGPLQLFFILLALRLNYALNFISIS
jgi:hypothetical protein